MNVDRDETNRETYRTSHTSHNIHHNLFVLRVTLECDAAVDLYGREEMACTI